MDERADVEEREWQRFVDLWWMRFRDRQVGIRELYGIAQELDIWNCQTLLKFWPEHSVRISFGRKLSARRDKVIGEFQVIQGTVKRARAVQWMLRRVSGEDEDIGEM